MSFDELFHPTHHEFIAGKSCTTQLFEVMKGITSNESMNNGDEIGITYLDFMKAFDKVPNRRLSVY